MQNFRREKYCPRSIFRPSVIRAATVRWSRHWILSIQTTERKKEKLNFVVGPRKKVHRSSHYWQAAGPPGKRINVRRGWNRTLQKTTLETAVDNSPELRRGCVQLKTGQNWLK